MRDHNDVGEGRMPCNDWRRRRLDQVRDLGRRKPAAQSVWNGCCEHHIADQAEADQQNAQRGSVLDDGLVDQHDRNVILHRIHAAAGLALQASAVFDQVDRCLAVGADENLQQRGIDGHEENIAWLGARGLRPGSKSHVPSLL